MRTWGRQSLLGSGVLSLVYTGWGIMLSLITIPIMINGLGLAGYGVYSLAFSIAGFGSYLDLGLGWAVSKFVAEADAQQDDSLLIATLRASLLYHVSVGLGFVAIVLPLADRITRSILHFSGAEASAMTQVLRIAAISFFCSSVGGVFVSALRGMRRFASATLVAAAGVTISSVGSATVAWLELGVLPAMIAHSLGAGVGMSLGAWICHRDFARKREGILVRRQLREMLGFSIWIYLNKLTQMMVFAIDKILVGRLVGPGFYPFYETPLVLAQRVHFIAAPAMTAIYPTAAAGQYQPESFLKQYCSGARIVHIFTAATGIATLVWGDRFLTAWVGPEMASQGGFFLRVFTVGFWLVSVGYFDGACIEGWNRPRVTSGIAVTSLLLAVVLGTACYPWLGAVRTIAASVGAYLCLVGIGQIVCWHRISKYPLQNTLGKIGLPVVEMAILGLAISLGLRDLLRARLLAMGMLPLLILGLATHGLLRSFTRGERMTILARFLSPLFEMANGRSKNRFPA